MDISSLVEGKQYGMRGRGRVMYSGKTSVTDGLYSCHWEYVFYKMSDLLGFRPILLTRNEVAEEVYKI